MGITYNPFSLKGKTILVTGASSGIGRATAIECAKMGANVIVTARNESRLLETKLLSGGGIIESIIADLNNAAELENLIAHLPEIDGLVLCAGKALTVPVKMATSEKFHDVMKTNFYAQADLLSKVFKKKKLKNGASVVIISSIGGNYIYEPGNVVYGASKAALNSYMRFAANEFSVRMIRVNSICPGMVETPLINPGALTKEQLDDYKSKYLMKRFGHPEEIAYAAIYLLSDAASWVTGTSLVIDGGSITKS